MTTLTDDELLAWRDRQSKRTGYALQTATRFRELLAQQEWQPIETAPKDGRMIMLRAHSEKWQGPAYWDGMTWICFRVPKDGFPAGHTFLWAFNAGPTHWRPLPAPPKDGE